MCGLFGGIGKEKKGGLNISKVKILGLYNMSRGKDSCGYFYNNTLKKGTFTERLFDSFIEKNVLAQHAAKNNVFIGHTRSATGNTTHTAENAHPFNVEDRLILAHNGTIGNVWDLCKKYNVEDKGIHVDSLALAVLIDKVGFSILNEYIGYAALLMHNTKEPNTLYVYHGASREFKSDEKLTEERPLFSMDTREAVYFSSLESALLAIRDSEDEQPTRVGHNQVFKFVNGKLQDEVFKVFREENNISTPKKIYSGNTVITNNFNGSFHNRSANHSAKESMDVFKKEFAPILSTKDAGDDVPFVLDNESKPERCFDEERFEKEEPFVYFHKGRYYMTDGSDLLDGEYFIDKQGFIFEKETSETIPYYFYRGVRLHNKAAWNTINKMLDDENSFIVQSSIRNFAREISRYSPYHVTNIDLEADSIPNISNVFYVGGDLATKGMQPKFSERSYKFTDGKLTGIHAISKTDIPWFDPKKGETAYINNRDKSQAALTIIKPEQKTSLVLPDMVEEYKKHFIKVCTHPDEIYSAPSIVCSAIEHYIADLNGVDNLITANDDVMSQLLHDCNLLISECINEKKPLSDVMTNGHYDYTSYIDLALVEEQCSNFKKKTEELKKSEKEESPEERIVGFMNNLRIDDSKQLTYDY